MTSLIDFDCRSCGACCSFSPTWPRFSTETEAALDLLPARFVAANEQGMRCEGARCSALVGRVGSETSCQVYDLRPDVCRACVPGDGACLTAREFFRIGLSNLPPGHIDARQPVS
ncbi:YkgJ family cysteine cluster protein [Rhizobium ruizarguesonis]|uniref:YkgJ family cysteine cluster protein n=1 Tax=Rhizobium ruizarguesonis TaxID=2081791 RepID=A0AB38HRK9_9HYPH|nr:YkgJ family cysteine cluster protein [Rhizobium ruizarguesonis]NEJ88504.1 YkgJ family cysteine cluster protein [Rhizobium ruizarguesonis]NEJ96006.1 YkgJ family cysteine cluster protein [Rhizobium ruizarguesonis]TAW60946.1 YkgJ family cysteine cluster protein [Rhizobium ruizarguesonis]TAX01909.1 YkgJ family cysteine cluster protein [Rhizobium ruizarguesonis]TAX04651.1 YkgJ family cysteine cluster protein [Rhizobium ruizarguesonis]